VARWTEGWFFVCLFGGTRFEGLSQGFRLAKQVLYYLRHPTSSRLKVEVLDLALTQHKLFVLSGPCFPHLSNEDKNPCLVGCDESYDSPPGCTSEFPGMA
jgi:hypothetical protein